MTMPGVAMPWLVGYYGVFQAGHVVLNVLYLSGLRPIQDFPPPPAEGWHPQATAFLTARSLRRRKNRPQYEVDTDVHGHYM